MDYSTDTAVTGLFTGMFLIVALAFGLAIHLFLGYCFKKIAEKAGVVETGIWWIPIVNLLLVVQAAGKPGWWLLLFLVPFVNFIVMFIVWIEVSTRLGHGTGWGVVAALVGIVGIPYLAFADAPNEQPVLA